MVPCIIKLYRCFCVIYVLSMCLFQNYISINQYSFMFSHLLYPFFLCNIHNCHFSFLVLQYLFCLKTYLEKRFPIYPQLHFLFKINNFNSLNTQCKHSQSLGSLTSQLRFARLNDYALAKCLHACKHAQSLGSLRITFELHMFSPCTENAAHKWTALIIML